MKNLVFIGMPGCGKTTISALLACKLNRPWYDSDQEIEAEEGCPITALFAQKGEAYFRAKETQVLTRLLKGSGVIIAAGGGAVLHNRALLKDNAVVIYLYRSVESILTTLETHTRPLLREGAQRLSVLYEQRRALYEQTGDFLIANEGSPQNTVQAILGFLAADTTGIKEEKPCEPLSSTDPI